MAKPNKKYFNLNRREKEFIKKKLDITKFEDVDTAILKKLKEEIKKLKDIRVKNKTTYKLWDVVICVIVASFANNNTWKEIHDFVVDNYDWFKSFLQMTGGIPKQDTYERIMGLINKDELNDLLFDFFKTITFELNTEYIIENYDGRTNNGSHKKATILNKEIKPLNCLNGYSNKHNYCFSTTEISDKSNEIPTIEKVLKGRNLENVIVTFDALNTQTKNISAIIKSGGDYIVPIKGNHPLFYQELVDYFDIKKCDEIKAGNSKSAYTVYVEKSHSSIITYELFQTSDVKWYSKKSDWEKLTSFGLVRKTIVKKELVKNTRKNAKTEKTLKETTSVENRYYISSRQVNINEFKEATRSHWNIENKIHWHLDFTFCQDKNSTSNKRALLNLEIVHKFVLACLERTKYKYDRSLVRIRKHLSNNFKEFFPEFICYLLLNSGTVLENKK